MRAELTLMASSQAAADTLGDNDASLDTSLVAQYPPRRCQMILLSCRISLARRSFPRSGAISPGRGECHARYHGPAQRYDVTANLAVTSENTIS